MGRDRGLCSPGSPASPNPSVTELVKTCCWHRSRAASGRHQISTFRRTDGHTYKPTYIHTYIHAYTHTYIHTYTQRPQTQIPKSSALDPIPKTLLESPKAEVRVRAKTSTRFQENSATPSPGAFDFVQEAFIYTIGSSKGFV